MYRYKLFYNIIPLLLIIFITIVFATCSSSNFATQQDQVASLPTSSVVTVGTLINKWTINNVNSTSTSITLSSTATYASSPIIPIQPLEEYFLSCSSSNFDDSSTYVTVILSFYNSQSQSLGVVYNGIYDDPKFFLSWNITGNGFSSDNVTIPLVAYGALITLQLYSSSSASVVISNCAIQEGVATPVGFQEITSKPFDLQNGTFLVSDTGYSGGILFSNSDGTLQKSNLNLVIMNSYPSSRQFTISYSISTYIGEGGYQGGRNILNGTVNSPVVVCPNSNNSVSISIPSNLANGHYFVDYKIIENGLIVCDWFTRFVVMTQWSPSQEEISRKDYVFGMWQPGIGGVVVGAHGNWFEQVFKAINVGVTYFANGFALYLQHYDTVNDPQINASISAGEQFSIPFFKRLGVRMAQDIEPTGIVVTGDDLDIVSQNAGIMARRLSENGVEIMKMGTEHFRGRQFGDGTYIASLQQYLTMTTDPTDTTNCGVFLGFCREGNICQLWQESLFVYAEIKKNCPRCRTGPTGIQDITGTLLHSIVDCGYQDSIALMDWFGLDAYFGGNWPTSVNTSKELNIFGSMPFAEPESWDIYFGGYCGDLNARYDGYSRNLEWIAANSFVNFMLSEKWDAQGMMEAMNIDGLPCSLGSCYGLGASCVDWAQLGRLMGINVIYQTLTQLIGASYPVSKQYPVYKVLNGSVGPGQVTQYVNFRIARPARVTTLTGDSYAQNGWLQMNISITRPTVDILDAYGNYLSRSLSVTNGMITVVASMGTMHIVEDYSDIYAPVYYQNQGDQISLLPKSTDINNYISSKINIWYNDSSLTASNSVNTIAPMIELTSVGSTTLYSNQISISNYVNENMFIGFNFATTFGANDKATITLVFEDNNKSIINNATVIRSISNGNLVARQPFAADNFIVPSNANTVQIQVNLQSSSIGSFITLHNIAIQRGTTFPIGFDGLAPAVANIYGNNGNVLYSSMPNNTIQITASSSLNLQSSNSGQATLTIVNQSPNPRKLLLTLTSSLTSNILNNNNQYFDINGNSQASFDITMTFNQPTGNIPTSLQINYVAHENGIQLSTINKSFIIQISSPATSAPVTTIKPTSPPITTATNAPTTLTPVITIKPTTAPTSTTITYAPVTTKSTSTPTDQPTSVSPFSSTITPTFSSTTKINPPTTTNSNQSSPTMPSSLTSNQILIRLEYCPSPSQTSALLQEIASFLNTYEVNIITQNGPNCAKIANKPWIVLQINNSTDIKILSDSINNGKFPDHLNIIYDSSVRSYANKGEIFNNFYIWIFN